MLAPPGVAETTLNAGGVLKPFLISNGVMTISLAFTNFTFQKRDGQTKSYSKNKPFAPDTGGAPSPSPTIAYSMRSVRSCIPLKLSDPIVQFRC